MLVMSDYNYNTGEWIVDTDHNTAWLYTVYCWRYPDWSERCILVSY